MRILKRIVIAIGLLVAVTVAANCTDEKGTLKTLRVSGYTNVTLTGHAFFKCGKEDGTCTGFVANAPNGERVEGAVSCSFWGCKGCTIRL